MALIGLATALTCILAPISLPLPFSPIPFSLGLLAIFLNTFILGAYSGLLSCILYILTGFVGLPVFSGFTGGAGILLGVTGGYIIGYLFIPLCALPITGNHLVGNHLLPRVLIGLVLCYLCGTLWMSYQSGLSYENAFLLGVLPYIPADIIKLLFAYSLSNTLRKRLRQARLI